MLLRKALSNDEDSSPFYLLASLQSMHGVSELNILPTIDEFEDECDSRVTLGGTIALEDDDPSEDGGSRRSKYCQMTLLTDKLVGDMIDSLKSNGLWDNTLVVFTTDNGGHTATGASNYPYRGTKGDVCLYRHSVTSSL